jgi:hypothetical protein
MSRTLKDVAALEPLRFNAEDLRRANAEWGCNCGPTALAAILGLTLAEVRSHLGQFETKRYTNPTMMKQALASLCVKWFSASQATFADYGLCRVQWSGPWLGRGIPIQARYRQTHWVASRWIGRNFEIFDVNALSAGGWITQETWQQCLVPWILKHSVPNNDGRWYLTHVWEIER